MSTFPEKWKKNFSTNNQIYLMLLPVLLYYFIFHYIPMAGTIIAFQDYKPAFGFFESNWVGLKHFIDFFSSPSAWRVVRNTLLINIYQILFAFPIPIILALLINEIRIKYFKAAVQTVSYIPYFISLVVVCGMLVDFSRTTGVINSVLILFGFEQRNLLMDESLFRPMYIVSGIWQNAGWGSIIYLATLSNIDPSLYEAAAIDGAGRFGRMIHISFPGLLPVIIVQFIMRIGNILSQGFEKIILLYNPLTYETADVISSYLYREGLLKMDYSYGAAVGIFNSIVNVTVLILVNRSFKRNVGQSLW